MNESAIPLRLPPFVTHILFASLEHVIHATLAQQIILHCLFVHPCATQRARSVLGRWRRIHPIKLLDSLPSSGLFLHALQLGELPFLFELLAQLVELLLLFVLEEGRLSVVIQRQEANRLTAFFSTSHTRCWLLSSTGCQLFFLSSAGEGSARDRADQALERTYSGHRHPS